MVSSSSDIIAERVLTLAEVAKHNSKDDLWIVIRDVVYDVTAFIDNHPGGDRVLIQLGGKDATENFDNVGHSDFAKKMLKKFQVGVIDDTEKKSNGRPKKLGAGDVTDAEYAALPIKTVADVSAKDGSEAANGELWIIVKNKVYDVTKFWKMHPGGAKAIKDVAGKDATVAFEKIGHTSNALNLLKKYLHARLPDDEAKDWSKLGETTMKQVTFAEVALHNKEADAWMVIDNRVIDVTSFLHAHPGGREPLLYYAGLDATDAFGEVGHSLNAKNKMKSYQIGVIVESERRTSKPTTCKSTSYSDVTAEALRTTKVHGEGGKFPLLTTLMILGLLLFSFGGVAMMIIADKTRGAESEL